MSGWWCEVAIRQDEVENVWTMLNNLLKHLRNMLAKVDQWFWLLGDASYIPNVV
jgi:hypothetical protein